PRVRTEQPGELGLVLRGLAGRPRVPYTTLFRSRARGADFDGLMRATGDGFLVVGFARVGRDPVVGPGLRRRGAVRGFLFAVAVDPGGAVGCDQAVFGCVPGFVVVELPADRPAGVRAEQPGELGLVLEGVADR